MWAPAALSFVDGPTTVASTRRGCVCTERPGARPLRRTPTSIELLASTGFRRVRTVTHLGWDVTPFGRTSFTRRTTSPAPRRATDTGSVFTVVRSFSFD